MKNLIVLVMVIFLLFLLTGCPAVVKPLQIDDWLYNDGELVFFDLRDFTNAQDIDTVVYEVVSGVGSIHGKYYYRWIADFHEDGGLSGVFEVTIRATNIRGREKEDTFRITVNRRPSEPVCLSPIDGSDNVGLSPLLSWTSYDPDVSDADIEDALLYDLYFGTNEEPPLKASDISYPYLQLSDLDYGQVYYWKVEVRDRNSMVEGDVWSFTTRKLHTLTVSIEGEGEVLQEVAFTPIGIENDYPYETVVELTAVPDTGWEFSHWSGDLTGDENPETIVIDCDKEVTAHFVRQEYGLTVSIEGEGEVLQEVAFTPIGIENDYPYETVVELTAVPDTGWEFSHWSGDLTGDENPETIVIDGDKEVTAHFVRQEYTLTANIEGAGQVEEEVVFTPTGYEYETEVKLTAVPDTGWEFVEWTGDLTGDENPETIVIDSDKEVTARFELMTIAISAIAAPEEGGMVTGAGEYNYGDEVELLATANEGYAFVNWTEDGSVVGEENTLGFTASEDRNLVANFVQDE